MINPSLMRLGAPENIILVQGDDVAVMFMPGASNLSAKQRKAIAATRGRKRFLVNACSNVPIPDGVSGPVKLETYPIDSLRWAHDRATLINIGIVDCSTSSSTPGDLAAVLAELDAKEDTTDHKISITLVTDRPFDAGEYISLCRPRAPHRMAADPSPASALETEKAN